ncbi:HAD family acid phosphatase [uncultured Roseobacter sp.]|uniref:phosphatase domain-containing protein n=1 Tax=uncultured Roseobacter sp. TaxID=114847 RepID=UPI002629ECA8|nr:HAD family acid phosphatase [uncultured Roseobacter sp.]
MKPTILFDIDGTIADIRHRRHFLDGANPDWRSFNSKMGDDTPNRPVVSLYRTLWESHNFQIILVSGRGEESRKITETWLTWNSIPFDRLLMRPKGDFRSDVVIKQELLDQLQKEGAQISFVVDDRNSVVNMWRRNGITCLQCAEGDF